MTDQGHDPIAEVAGEEILPVAAPGTTIDSSVGPVVIAPPTGTEPAAVPAEDPGPREIEFPDRLLVDDLDEIEEWAAENNVPLQPRPVRTGWIRYAVAAVALLALAAYATLMLT